MSERFYGRQRVHSSNGKYIADVECWGINTETIYRAMIYNANMFLVFADSGDNREGVINIISDYFDDYTGSPDIIWGDLNTKEKIVCEHKIRWYIKLNGEVNKVVASQRLAYNELEKLELDHALKRKRSLMGMNGYILVEFAPNDLDLETCEIDMFEEWDFPKN